jgi:hypothetical protein
MQYAQEKKALPDQQSLLLLYEEKRVGICETVFSENGAIRKIPYQTP